MKTIEDLKQGDRFYDVDNYRVKWYTYLCVHPKGGGNYHILIDQNEEPIRIYIDKLQDILNKNLSTYDEAKKFLITKLNDKITYLTQEN